MQRLYPYRHVMFPALILRSWKMWNVHMCCVCVLILFKNWNGFMQRAYRWDWAWQLAATMEWCHGRNKYFTYSADWALALLRDWTRGCESMCFVLCLARSFWNTRLAETKMLVLCLIFEMPLDEFANFLYEPHWMHRLNRHLILLKCSMFTSVT